MKLHFVCIGAQKAGTTTLHDILKGHPDICLPEEKEAHFFEINERYEKGQQYFYDTFFRNYNGQPYLGNINPNLHIDKRNIDRLYECYGKELKILFILRDPVKRAFSHHCMTSRLGYEKAPFMEALGLEEYRRNNTQLYSNYETNEVGHYEKNVYSYINRGLYYSIVDHLYKVFPRGNVKLVLFEEFIKDQENQIKEILNFLQIPRANLDYNRRSNVASSHKSEMLWQVVNRNNKVKQIANLCVPKKLKGKLRKSINRLNSQELSISQKQLSPEILHDVYKKYFEDDIKKLESLESWNLDLWKH